jgi:hypothetical protein
MYHGRRGDRVAGQDGIHPDHRGGDRSVEDRVFLIRFSCGGESGWGAFFFIVFTIISIVLLTGHGANMIAGYNTAGKEEKVTQDFFIEFILCQFVLKYIIILTSFAYRIYSFL